MTAQLEEVVVYAQMFDAKRISPYRSEDLLGGRARRDDDMRRLLPRLLDRWQRLIINLTVERQR